MTLRSGSRRIGAAGVLVAAVGFPLLLAAQATAPGPTPPMGSPASPQPGSTPIASPQQSQLELDKLNAETQKLREEIYALRVTNEAIDPISKWAFGLLTAAGLTAALNVTRETPDITARLPQPGGRDITVIIDDDGYIELRFWAGPGTTPSQITTTLTRAISVVTG